MRYAIAAALSALVIFATVSVASAQNPQVPAPPRATTNPAPTVRDNAPRVVRDDNANGFNLEQENAIPYRPCIEATGWVNGHLRCNN